MAVDNQSVGLQRGMVELRLYSSAWAQVFEHEKMLLTELFGASATAVEHIGSTAVPGMTAKPIIDIMVGLRNFESWVAFTTALEGAGYVYMPDRVKADEVFMPKGPDKRRTHYLHIVEHGSREWKRCLKFRDLLRDNERLRSEYAALKAVLAQRFPGDRRAYSAAKAAFIERNLSA